MLQCFHHILYSIVTRSNDVKTTRNLVTLWNPLEPFMDHRFEKLIWKQRRFHRVFASQKYGLCPYVKKSALLEEYRKRTTHNLHEGSFCSGTYHRGWNTHVVGLENCYFTVEVTRDKRSIPNRGITFLAAGCSGDDWTLAPLHRSTFFSRKRFRVRSFAAQCNIPASF